jgi:hypothetical protein
MSATTPRSAEHTTVPEVTDERSIQFPQLIGIEIEGDHSSFQKARVLYAVLYVLGFIGIQAYPLKQPRNRRSVPPGPPFELRSVPWELREKRIDHSIPSM